MAMQIDCFCDLPLTIFSSETFWLVWICRVVNVEASISHMMRMRTPCKKIMVIILFHDFQSMLPQDLYHSGNIKCVNNDDLNTYSRKWLEKDVSSLEGTT